MNSEEWRITLADDKDRNMEAAQDDECTVAEGDAACRRLVVVVALYYVHSIFYSE